MVISLALSRSGLFTLSSPTPFVIGAVGLTLAAALVLVERRTWQPLLAPLFFRSRAFVTANLAQLLEGVALIIALVTVPMMANTVMGKEPLTGAWWLLRMTVAIPIGAVIGGYLLRLIGIRPVTIAGLGLAALGLFLVSTWELDVAEPWLTLHLMVAGFGFGLNNTPIMTRALSSLGLDHQATCASLVTVSRMLGTALGIARPLLLGSRALPDADRRARAPGARGRGEFRIHRGPGGGVYRPAKRRRPVPVPRLFPHCWRCGPGGHRTGSADATLPPGVGQHSSA